MPAQASVRVPVRWRDLDLLGHLNQAVYHEYLEEARGALMASLGPDIRFPFVLARVELDYLSEVRRDHGEVEVVARVDRGGHQEPDREPRGAAARRHRGRHGLVGVRGLGRRRAWLAGLTDAERAALEA